MPTRENSRFDRSRPQKPSKNGSDERQSPNRITVSKTGLLGSSASLGILVIAGLCAPSAFAATSQQPLATTTIETVVVTAEKRPEQLKNVPVSVFAVGSEGIRQQGANDVKDLAAL